MPVTHDQLRREFLRLLNSVTPIHGGRSFNFREYSFYAMARKEIPGEWTQGDFMQVMWRLLAEGLVFINYSQDVPENWSWYLSGRGTKAVESGTYDPADPDGYLKRLSAIPGLDARILLYAREALLAFESRCYLASTVMLGVASEAAFDILSEAFGRWAGLSEGEAQKFRDATAAKQYAARFEEFRKRLAVKKPQLPSELSDGLDIILDGVLDLLRTNRNDAGHPTGRQVDEPIAYTSLQLFERYLGRLYALKGFFEANPRP